MNKGLYILLVCICFSFVTDNTPFSIEQIDTKTLESLIVKRLNDVRVKEHLNPLTENVVLKKAAEDQAKYISSIGKLSHRQPNKKKEKARNRVVFYGGNMQGVGENTAYITVFETALYRGEHGQVDTVNITSMKQATDYITYAWMNSESHKTNILYEKYSETGLKVIYNKQRKTLFAVQVFAYPYE